MKKIVLLSLLILNFLYAARSQNNEQLIDSASRCIETGHYSQALNIYTRILTADKKHARAYALRADLFAELERPEEAISDYDNALRLADSIPLKITILENRAEAKRRVNDHEGAATDFQQALSYDPDNIAALVNLGALLPHLDKPREAISCLEKVISLDSTFESGYGYLAFLYSNLEEYQKALEISNKLLAFKPDEAYALNNRGFIKYKLNDLQGALEDINTSINLLPDNSYAFKNRGLIYAALKKKNEACADFQKALNLGFARHYGQAANEVITVDCKQVPR